MGDWAELPSDLLTHIAKRIHLYEDFVTFGGVCRPWRSVAVKDNFNQSSQIPWLMLAPEKEGNTNIRSFMSLAKGGMVRKVELREARCCRCISSMGWLITIDEYGDMELLHPLTRVRIPLPHPKTYKYYNEIVHQLWIRRAVLSASPSETENYVVMIILGENEWVGFWKPGNKIWNAIEPQPSYCNDVIYYKDKFYAINRSGEILHCDLNNSGMSQIVGRVPAIKDNQELYLVECGGELLVLRGTGTQINGNSHFQIKLSFRVLTFDWCNLDQWREIHNLGGRSIFLGGHSATIAVTASAAGTIPNCIYYTDDGFYVERYAEVYLRGSKWGYQKKEPLRSSYYSEHFPPMWVFPSH